MMGATWIRGVLPKSALSAFLIIALLVAVAGATPMPRAFAATITFTVNSTDDTADNIAGDGVCGAQDGPCTLRAAIMESNAASDANAILFSFPGSGPYVISPHFEMPVVANPVTIDGTTQPGFAGVPLVVLSGSQAGAGTRGLVITAGESTVRAIEVSDFSGSGIELRDNGNNHIYGNVIQRAASTAGCLGPAPANQIKRKYIGNLGAFTDDSWAQDINDCGQTVGWSQGSAPGSMRRAFLWLPAAAFGLPAGMSDLTTIAGLRSADAINNKGQIVGSVDSTTLAVWDRGTLTQLPPNPICQRLHTAVDINDAGEILANVPSCELYKESTFVWFPVPAHGLSAGWHDLGFLSTYQICGTDGCHTASSTVAYDINDRGQIAGATRDAQGKGHLFRWESGSMIDLGELRIADNPQINRRGDIAYTTISATGECPPCQIFLRSNGHTTDLGTLGGDSSQVMDMNDVGDIVGISSLPVSSLQSHHAFWWHDGEIKDLGTLGGTLSWAMAINNRRQVAGVSAFSWVKPWRATVWTVGGETSSGVPAGIVIADSPGNEVGSEDSADRNVVTEAGGNGIRIEGPTSVNNSVTGNNIGLEADGLTPGPNKDNGVAIVNASSNEVGANIIAGNTRNGVYIEGTAASSNALFGNRIGTDADGRTALPNGGDGIRIADASNNVIGGVALGPSLNERNIIAGNTGDGIHISGPQADFNIVQGNIIGLDSTSSGPLGNGGDGISVDSATHTRIGGEGGTPDGPCTGSCNVIGANGKNGISISSSTSLNTNAIVQGNYVGTDAAGRLSRPSSGESFGNMLSGVAIVGAHENRIGGRSYRQGNVISGNHLHGVEFFQADRNIVEGNRIGTNIYNTADPDGIPDNGDELGNGGDGVLINSGSRNVIGWPTSEGVPVGTLSCETACNRISGSFGSGISVRDADSQRNSIRGNAIHGNVGLGIDLGGDGRSKNDLGEVGRSPDADVGPNGLVNFPVGIRADFDGVNTHISGLVDAGGSLPAPAELTVDIYASATPHASGFGGSEVYLGEASVVSGATPSGEPDGTGLPASFVLTLHGPLPSGLVYISATASDSQGATSEFSPVCGDPDGDGNPDSDNDGLCDDWEIHGIDYDGDGSTDLALNEAPYNADPAHKDLFVEVDFMLAVSPSVGSYFPDLEALDDVVHAFDQAPVDNPDGNPGIHLHVTVDDDLLPETENIYFRSREPGAADDFSDFKHGSNSTMAPGIGILCGTREQDGHFGTDDDRSATNCKSRMGSRSLVYRYAIFGHSYAESLHPISSGTSSWGDFMVTLGNWSSGMVDAARGQRELEAGTFMHELGHSLGLCHGGPIAPGQITCAGDRSVNYKPNYLSIMSYTFQTKRNVLSRPLDYSRWSLPTLDEQNLNEFIGVGGATPPSDLAVRWPETAFTYYKASSDTCPFEVTSTVPSGGTVDWDHNGPGDSSPVQAGINDWTDEPRGPLNPEDCQIYNDQQLHSYEDWHELRFSYLAYDTAARVLGVPPNVIIETN